MLPHSFDSCFVNLDSIYSYNTRRNSTKEFFVYRARTEMGKKKLHHICCLKVWKNIPKKDRDVSFYRFKKLFKINCLSKYEKMLQFHEKCSYLRSSYIRETLQVVFSFRHLNILLKPAITTSKRTAKKCR